MAQKRMFDRAIIDTDNFMDMPISSKGMYFLLGLEADDEGFVSYRKVLRIHGGAEDDVNILVARGFLIKFKSGVVVITDWNTNNWLDSRRIRATEYKKERDLLSLTDDKKYVLSNGLASIEERSIEEDSIALDSLRSPEEKPNDYILKDSEETKSIVRILELFSALNPAVKTMYGNKTQRKACSELLQRYNLEEIEKMITTILPVTNKKEYYPIINTPYELNIKFQTLIDRIHQDKSKNRAKEETVIINGVIMKKPL